MLPRWGIVIHGSHRGRVQGNVVLGCEHAGIVTEDGSEAHNVIDGNLVMGVTNGHGCWVNGTYNRVTNNVFAACWADPSRLIASHYGSPPRPVYSASGNERGGYGMWVPSNYEDGGRRFVVPRKDGLGTETFTRAYVALGNPTIAEASREPVEGNMAYGCRFGGLEIDHALGRHRVGRPACHSCWGV